jgi:glyoxylate reductase
VKIVIAPDSFKGSVTACDAAQALAAGWKQVLPDSEVIEVPMADGGEGTAEALVSALNGSWVTSEVTGPLHDRVVARYGRAGDTAIIEMAAASGLPLVDGRQDVLHGTTLGTGELIKHALDAGANRIILGLGGSATCDGGIGALTALGARFLDNNGNEVSADARGLASLASVDRSQLSPCSMTAVCDVVNPLTGEYGAARVFGPQKGATPEQVEELEAGLSNLARLCGDMADMPGAGAAGGLGAALAWLLGAKLVPGSKLVSEAVGLREKMHGADLVLTGEGQVNGQSVMGKAPTCVSAVAKELGIPVVLFSGALGTGYKCVYTCGVTRVVKINPEEMPLKQCLERAAEHLKSAAEDVANEWKPGKKLMKPSLFVTRKLPEPAMEHLQEVFDVTVNPDDRVLSKQEVIDGVKGKDALLSLLTDSIDREVIESNTGLRVISNYAVGFNNIDTDAAQEYDIPVCITPGVLTDTTADLTFTLILSVARRVPEGDRLTRAGEFHGWGPLMMLGNDVYGKTLGIVGMGRIGQAVAKRAAGFDMKILYTARSAKPDAPGTHVELDELLSQSDFVSIHVPMSSKTRHLIGEKQLQQMKSTAYLINTARGPIVDENALVHALQNGIIAGAGLDVFEEEPALAPGLAELDNTVLLPHIGSATVETRTRMAMMAAENAIAVIRGEVPAAMA